MVTATDVQRVGRTAQPHQVRDGVVLDIDWVVKYTTMKDWDGSLYELGASAAAELAMKFNADHRLVANGKARKLPTTK